VQIKLIAIRGPRSAIPAVFKAALELREEPEVITEMHVCMDHIALEQIAVLILRSASPKIVVVIFVALADIAAECEVVDSVGIERDEFDRVKKIRRVIRAPEIIVGLVVTNLFEGGRAGGREWLLGCSARRRGKEKE